MMHTALTATARAYPDDAGKALGIASLGFSVAQAALPPLAVPLIGWMGWRWVAGAAPPHRRACCSGTQKEL